MKHSFILAALLLSVLMAARPKHKHLLTQKEITAIAAEITAEPSGYKAIQTDCSDPHDKDSVTLAHGCICTIGSNLYCVENPCPEGTVRK
jgi:hypothetical protein